MDNSDNKQEKLILIEEQNDIRIITDTEEGKERQNNRLTQNDGSIENDKSESSNDKSLEYDYDLYADANPLSRLFFAWSFSVLSKAKQTILTPNILGKVSEKYDSAHFCQFLKYYWEDKNYKAIKSNALMKAILRANTGRLFIILILSLLSSATEYLLVLIIKEYIDLFEGKNSQPDSNFPYKFNTLQLGIAFIIIYLINIFVTWHSSMKQSIFGLRAGFELSCFIYSKILTVSPSSFSEKATQGEILNFIQVDSNQLNWMIQSSPRLFICPIMIAAYIYLLFNFFGFAFIAGMTIIWIFFGINYKIFNMYRRIQKDMLTHKDERMKVTTEAFDNIKILKLYNWENVFKEKILDAREQELKSMKRGWNVSTVNISLFWLCPMLVSISTIGVYQYFNDSFNISTLLIGLAIFSRLQDPIRQLPGCINSILETFVSMSRIEKFWLQTDLNESYIHKENFDESKDYAIKINNGSFTWGAKPKKEDESKEGENTKKQSKFQKEVRQESNESTPIIPKEENEINTDIINKPKNNQFSIDIPNNVDYDIILSNINLHIKPGQIVGIIGEVGGGKSSLLQAILNSLIWLNPNECDGIHINGTIGYVSQNPWIQNATIKNNILFFKEYSKEKYEKILEVSQLNHDLSNFEGKDQTEIGEKGVNLSGGQKVRVSFARALYSEPDIYLFDDPISALDANIGKRIMKDCIIKYLKGKTRVIVTHALHYLKHMDSIIYISKGKITWTGNYHELLEQEFFDSLSKLSKLSRKKASNASDDSAGIDFDNRFNLKGSKENEIASLKSNKTYKIIKDEDQEIGGVKLDIYIKYFIYMGGVCVWIMIFFIMLFWQLNKAGSDLWLAFWSKKENQEEDVKYKNKKWVFFGIFSALGWGSVLFIFFRIFLLTRCFVRLARSLHKDMLEKLIKAPINLFHEAIPRGQIYNRLSKDLETLRISIYFVGDYLVSGFSIFGALAMCSIYDIYSLAFCPIMLILGYFLTTFYWVGSRQLSRLESVSRSPMLNTISETWPGWTVIRAFGRKEDYTKSFYNSINNCFKVNICWNGVSNWFNEQFNLISIGYLIYLVTITIVFEDTFTAQSVGIMFTYSLLLQKNLATFFQYSAYLENNMISMERCVKYTTIESEKDSVTKWDEKWIQEKWPLNGKIKFDNYSVKYRPETEVVWKKINFEIQPTERVGVVGRTGSGKSTICLCLFRILEPMEGTIFIDNENICDIGLDLLRQKLTIIPQDPCLMQGTLKYNIDPFNQAPDKEIIRILNEIGFYFKDSNNEENVKTNSISDNNSTPNSILDKMIEQNGSNLSVGERQLVCIARAIIRKTKIIVMDEATANIDMKTEEKIQHALNETLKGSTIITIAHRIKTIIGYDKILVLDDGKVAEFDTPSNLLKDGTSLFHELYSKSVM